MGASPNPEAPAIGRIVREIGWERLDPRQELRVRGDDVVRLHERFLRHLPVAGEDARHVSLLVAIGEIPALEVAWKIAEVLLERLAVGVHLDRSEKRRIQGSGACRAGEPLCRAAGRRAAHDPRGLFAVDTDLCRDRPDRLVQAGVVGPQPGGGRLPRGPRDPRPGPPQYGKTQPC